MKEAQVRGKIQDTFIAKEDVHWTKDGQSSISLEPTVSTRKATVSVPSTRPALTPYCCNQRSPSRPREDPRRRHWKAASPWSNTKSADLVFTDTNYTHYSMPRCHAELFQQERSKIGFKPLNCIFTFVQTRSCCSFRPPRPPNKNVHQLSTARARSPKIE